MQTSSQRMENKVSKAPAHYMNCVVSLIFKFVYSLYQKQIVMPRFYSESFIPIASPLEHISANNIHRCRLTNRDSLSNYPVALFAVLVAEETLYILRSGCFRSIPDGSDKDLYCINKWNIKRIYFLLPGARSKVASWERRSCVFRFYLICCLCD